MAKKNIKVKELSVQQSYLFALLGLVLGFIYAVGGLVLDVFVSLHILSEESTGSPGLSLGTLLAMLALPVLAILGSLVGYLFGFVTGHLYNLVIAKDTKMPKSIF